MNTSIRIPVLRLKKDSPLPAYATPGSAALDLPCALDTPFVLQPGTRCMIPTGIAIALPCGYEAQIRSRSGLALKQGVIVLNSPATIDYDYREELKILLINHGEEPFQILPGMRIAQMLIVPIPQIIWEEVSTLTEGAARHQGFGSTGL